MILWREVLRVTIPGVPIPKGRPRFAMRYGKPVAYTDQKTEAYEKLIALCVASSTQLRKVERPLCGTDAPVRMDLLVVFPRPVRMMASKYPSGLIAHQKRPDLDNVIKICADGIGRLNGLIWRDDGQISCIRADSFYAEKGQGPRLEVALFVPTE